MSKIFNACRVCLLPEERTKLSSMMDNQMLDAKNYEKLTNTAVRNISKITQKNANKSYLFTDLDERR